MVCGLHRSSSFAVLIGHSPVRLQSFSGHITRLPYTNFIRPLPEDEGKNFIITFTDRLGSDIQLVTSRTDITAEKLVYLFFDNWYCENGLPTEIISDWDKLFTSRFWKALHKLSGVKLKMSTAYHLEMDGASERTNKTVNQALHYRIEWNQLGWV